MVPPFCPAHHRFGPDFSCTGTSGHYFCCVGSGNIYIEEYRKKLIEGGKEYCIFSHSMLFLRNDIVLKYLTYSKKLGTSGN